MSFEMCNHAVVKIVSFCLFNKLFIVPVTKEMWILDGC